MARVKINRTLSRAYARDWSDEHLVDPLAREIQAGARRRAPVRTGGLRASIYNTKQIATLRVTRRVGSRLNYSYLVQTGTKPHRIVPRRTGGRLVFFWRKVNGWVSLKVVNHPGFKGVPYLQRPLVEFGTARRFKVILFPTLGG